MTSAFTDVYPAPPVDRRSERCGKRAPLPFVPFSDNMPSNTTAVAIVSKTSQCHSVARRRRQKSLTLCVSICHLPSCLIRHSARVVHLVVSTFLLHCSVSLPRKISALFKVLGISVARAAGAATTAAAMVAVVVATVAVIPSHRLRKSPTPLLHPMHLRRLTRRLPLLRRSPPLLQSNQAPNQSPQDHPRLQQPLPSNPTSSTRSSRIPLRRMAPSPNCSW